MTSPQRHAAKQAVLSHLSAFPDAKLTVFELKRKLGYSDTVLRAACDELYREVKLWRIDQTQPTPAIRFQIHPRLAKHPTLTIAKV